MNIRLPIARYRFVFLATSRLQTQHFLGSSWRGVFGHALKRTVCVTGEASCTGCMLSSRCSYSYIFETPPPEDSEWLGKSNAIPHPFVLSVPLQQKVINEGDEFELGITLIGRANVELPYIVHAMQRAGTVGLTNQKLTYTLEDIIQEDGIGTEAWKSIYQQQRLQALPIQPLNIPPTPLAVRLTFETPLRVKVDRRLMTPRYFQADAFLRQIMRRVSMLTRFHGDEPLVIDSKQFVKMAEKIDFENSSLRWLDWTRYSSRQKETMQMGGIVGECLLKGDALEVFWPLLWTAQWVHVGKATSMGLGRFTVQTTEYSTAKAA